DAGGDHFAHLISCLGQGGQNLLLVLVAKGLQGHLQLHTSLTVDVDKLVVIQLDDVDVFSGHQLSHTVQLAGPIGQLYREGEDAAPVDEPVLHQGGDGDHIHIAAGEHRHHILALALQMAQGGDGEQACIFHHHLVLLHHIQEGVYQLSISNGEDVVHV